MYNNGIERNKIRKKLKHIPFCVAAKIVIYTLREIENSRFNTFLAEIYNDNEKYSLRINNAKKFAEIYIDDVAGAFTWAETPEMFFWSEMNRLRNDPTLKNLNTYNKFISINPECKEEIEEFCHE